MPLQPASRGSDHSGQLLQAEHVRAVGCGQTDGGLDVAAPPGRVRAAVVDVPAPDQHACSSTLGPCASSSATPRRSRRSTTTSWPRRSPAPAPTSSSSRRASASARRPTPDGYERRELFYPWSSRAFRRSALRLPLKAARASARDGAARACAGGRRPPAVARLAEARPDTPAAPRSCRLHRPRPAARGARRADRDALARPLRALPPDRRPQRARPRACSPSWACPRSGCASSRTPSSRATRPRADDGRTLLALGVIRPYKGLGDAIEATKRIDGARLLVVGDPMEPVDGYRAAAGERAEWRLGYLPDAELDRALGETTVARLPLPGRARPVGRAAARARRRRAGGRLRRRRARRARAARSAPGASSRPATSTRSPRRPGELLDDPGCARGRTRGRATAPGPS